MSRRMIFKHVFDVDDLKLPADAVPLCVDRQHSDITLWYTVDPSKPHAPERAIWIVATGAVAPDNATYVGTVQQPPYVWHVFVEDRA